VSKIPVVYGSIGPSTKTDLKFYDNAHQFMADINPQPEYANGFGMIHIG
jgi:hypothetical protein